MLGNANTVSNDWLYTEQNTAGKTANSINEWNAIEEQKDLFGLLEYSAILDDRTREDHRALDGTVRPVDDPFWDDFMPPNGYNCRCLLVPTIEGTKEITDKPKVSEAEVPTAFRNNPAKSGKIFTNKHPYLADSTAAQRRSNFGLGYPDTVGRVVEVIKPVVVKPKPEVKKVDTTKIKTRVLEIDKKELDEDGVLNMKTPTAKQKANDLNKKLDANVEAVDDYTIRNKVGTPTATTKAQALKNETEWVKSLDETQKADVYNYTTSSFVEINGALRGRSGFTDLNNVPGFNKMVDNLSNTIREAPKYKGVTNRGLMFDNKADFQKFVEGNKTGVFHEKGFMSTSLNDIKDNRFLQSPYTVQMEVQGKNGVLITDLTTNPDDLEVLFNKGTNFEILEAKATLDDWNETGVLKMKLKEL